jgi:hypothetical protein
MSLGFFGATDENLCKSDAGMSVGEISIQVERMFEFSDAPRSALGIHLDIPQQRMAARVVGDRGQGFGQLRFGRGKRRRSIGRQELYAFNCVRGRRSNERLDIVGIGGQRAIKKAARLPYAVIKATDVMVGLD